MRMLVESASSVAKPRGVHPGVLTPVRVIAVASGKGGVGKTCIAVNLCLALIELGKRTMLLDADLALANVDVMLGVNARRNLSHLLRGECRLTDILIEGPGGLKVVPASSGLGRMTRLGMAEQAGLIHAFSELQDVPDVLIVDTAAGIGDAVCNFCVAAQEVLVTLSPEPAAITDAYALIKVLSREYGLGRFHLVINVVSDQTEAQRVFDQVSRVVDRYLQVSLNLLGWIPRDPALEAGVRAQRAVMHACPRSPSAQALRQIARKIDLLPWSDGSSGNGLEFFVERLLKSRQRFVE